MDTYTELMAKKRNGSKKTKMSKELSQSFHMGQQKKSTEHKRSYLESYVNTVNRYLGKENMNMGKVPSTQKAQEMYKNTLSNRFYMRRNTTE